MKRSLIKQFKNPGSEFHGAPFWAWNGKLQPRELRRQIRVMKRMGLGGFFMHSRIGLNTAYLSDEWFDCIEACIDEAKKQDMQAWLYDEDRWPSGAAGGRVTRNPEYRQRSLVMELFEDTSRLKRTGDTLSVFVGRIEGSVISDFRHIAKGRSVGTLAPGESILHFTIQIDRPSSWFNEQTYLDTMNPEAVGQFIKVTHQAYRKRFGKHFGKTVPGIFTDEPQHGFACRDGENLLWEQQGSLNPELEKHKTYTPWTGHLPVVFKARYGYDILARLPEIFFDVAGRNDYQVRWNYHDCLVHLFVESFAQQIGRWCDKNGMIHTGHIMNEDSLSAQTAAVGSCMRFYEHMQAPGIDMLTANNRALDNVKQVSSAARQFDKKWRLTETNGCTGWDFPFYGHKQLGDWQAALGVNFRSQHLSFYTTEGEAKRDYPASILHQSPWWEHYSKVEDYFGRLHAVMTCGREVRDLLVVHPIESMWALFRKGHKTDPEVAALDRMMIELRDTLLYANIDYDYGDEDIMARHGSAGRLKGHPVLHVGKARYRAVIVPPLVTIRRSTLELLGKFRALGGEVIFAGKVPRLVDAVGCNQAKILAGECSKAPAGGPKLVAAVEVTSRRVSIADASGKAIFSTLHLLREDTAHFYLFVCNTSYASSQIRPTINDKEPWTTRRKIYDDVRIRGFSECKGRPLELDLDTGEVFEAEACSDSDGLEIRTDLPRFGSRLFVIPKKAERKRYAKRPTFKNVRTSTMPRPGWDFTLSESNVIVLDWPRYRIGAGRWQRADEILHVDNAVRDALAIDRRGARMVQPWARQRPARLKRTDVTLAYSFQVKTIPSGDLMLALERPASFKRIEVNGNSISLDNECGWWFDPSCRRLRLDPSMLCRGENRIVLVCDYDELHPGLEIVYLLGNFGTKLQGSEITMIDLPQKLTIGDWTRQGLAFYSGSLCYRRTIRPTLDSNQRLFVRLPDYKGVGARVLVDAQPVGIVAWEPSEIDITDFVGGKGQAVQLQIEILGSRRNSHGPFHLNIPFPMGIGPASYTTTGHEWTDEYNVEPGGLTAPPELVVKQIVGKR